MKLNSVIPLLRIFDEQKAKQFYVDFLEFRMDWEHRFEPGMPLYIQISRGGVTLHLTEHHGDCTPGGAVRLRAEGLSAFQASLLDKSYAYARPGLEQTPWGTTEMTVTDPFGNRIIYYEDRSEVR